MIKQSQCATCATFFMYKTEDSTGKFCSRSCYYKSRNMIVICKNCGKEFTKRLKDKRKTCSLECYKLRKGSSSKDQSIKELSRIINSKIAGQTSLDGSSIPGNMPHEKSSCCDTGDNWIERIKNFIMDLFNKS